VILGQSVIIIISFFLVSLIEFGDADAQEQDIFTNDVNALFKKGVDLLELGKFEEAIGNFDKVLAIEPNHVDTLNNKGFALHNLGQYKESIEYYNKILARTFT
jgi:tetratricopeptide (TPR) repeat protein